MAERIDVPPTLQGDEQAQLQQVWSYLYQLSEAINNNLEGIGGNELTDSERQTMQMILSAGEKAPELSEAETLKSLIIKTADFVQTSLQEYKLNLLGETVASGKFGRYVRSTGLDVAVTPEGITQNYSFQEIIQGLKLYEINAKNYIKTGLLRTVNSLPVYGVAIGKDVVTFSEDGTETYNDGNKFAELTADELSFWQNGVKVAGYTGSKISFYYNGTEAFYIQNGKLYCAADLVITNGNKMILASGSDIEIESGGSMQVTSGGKFAINNPGFTVSSEYKYIKIGDGRFEEEGLLFEIDNSTFGKTITSFGNYHYSSISEYPKLSITTYVNPYYQDPNLTAQTVYFTFQEKTGELQRILFNNLWNRKPWIYCDRRQASGGATTIIGGQLGLSGGGEWDIIANNITYSALNQTSSREIKHDIQKMESNGDRIDQLEPVTFIYNSDPEERRRTGLIYEDTVGIMPEICTETEDFKAINYVELIPMLLKEIQDLRARVKALEERQG